MSVSSEAAHLKDVMRSSFTVGTEQEYSRAKFMVTYQMLPYRLRINYLFSDDHQTVRSTLQIKENPDSRIFSQVPKIHFLEVGLHYISFQHQHCSAPKSPCRTSKVKEANKLQRIL